MDAAAVGAADDDAGRGEIADTGGSDDDGGVKDEEHGAAGCDESCDLSCDTNCDMQWQLRH